MTICEPTRMQCLIDGIHGEPIQAVATLVFDGDIPDSAVSVYAVSISCKFLSDEDLEEIFNSTL